MKKSIVLLLFGCVILSGCGSATAEVTEVGAFETEEITEELSSQTEAIEVVTEATEVASEIEEDIVIEDVVTLEGDAQHAALDEMYKRREVYHSQLNPAATWERTNTHSGHAATIALSSVTSEGFDFYIEAYYFAHEGQIEGHADFADDNSAISLIGSSSYIIFVFDNDQLNVYTSEIAGEFGLGHNVTINGEYTSSKPTYTNADVFGDLYTASQLDVIKNTLTDEQYERFEVATTDGAIIVNEEDGGKQIDVFVPGIVGCGYGYTIVIVDNDIISFVFDDGEEVVF